MLIWTVSNFKFLKIQILLPKKYDHHLVRNTISHNSTHFKFQNEKGLLPLQIELTKRQLSILAIAPGIQRVTEIVKNRRENGHNMPTTNVTHSC